MDNPERLLGMSEKLTQPFDPGKAGIDPESIRFCQELRYLIPVRRRSFVRHMISGLLS